MEKSKIVLVAVLLLSILACSCFVNAYNPPLGDNPIRADPTQPRKCHELIARQAIQILRNDHYEEIANAVERNLQAIIDGLKAADDEFGRIRLNILGLIDADWNTAGNTHYYNPNERHPAVRGLKVGALYVPDSVIYAFFGWTGDSNKAFALRGPQPAANRLADWYYALAVKAMREGRMYDAYFNLGKAIHLVQDLTVPQHATDSYGLPQHRHQDFENYAEGYMLRADYLATTAYPGDLERTTYFPDMPVSVFAEVAAQNSAEKISKVTGWHGNDFDGVEREMLLLAQRLTAGLLHKFHEKWQTEPYSAIKLTVHKAQALDRPDDLLSAELFTSLNVIEPGEPTSGRASYSYEFTTDDFLTGYFGDEDTIYPGSYLGYDVWTFPYTSDTVRTGEEVKMILGLWDDDDPYDSWSFSYHWPWKPHWIDINPNDGYRLYLKANLRTAEISRWTGSQWQVIGLIGERITSQGRQSGKDWTHGGRGVIEFTIEGSYVPAREPVPHSPQKPVNVFPAGQYGVALTPTLMASSYVDIDGDAQRESEWKIGEIPGDIVYQALGGPRNSHTLTKSLEWGKLYGWTVRYQDSTGRWSEWSTPTLFRINYPPAKPTNELPANGATNVSVTPHLIASAYSDYENQTHVASEWRIYYWGYEKIDGLFIRVPVTAYTYVSARATSHIVPTDSALLGNTTYYWQVRYKDAVGAWSEWSNSTSFTTSSTFIVGVSVTAPKAGETLYAGQTYNIAWQTTGSGIASVDIAYSIDAGKTWSAIAAGEPNDRAYSWTVPNTPSNTCLVMIIARDSNGRALAEGYSRDYFTILRGQQ